jgi:putative hydrolase of the HAD superfamily
VSSEESGADKPHIKSFKLALDKLSIDPSKVWMIGDNADADIVGGNLCGMITIQKVHNGVALGKSESTPHIVFDDFQELMGYYLNL